MTTAHPVQISIGATLAASLGAAVRGAQAQLNQLGSTMSELGNSQSGLRQLETLRTQARDAALAMRAAQQKVSGLEANIAAQQGAATAKQTRELERAQAAANRAAQAYQSKRAAVDELSSSLQRAGVNTRAQAAEAARLGSQLETLRTRTEALSRAQQAQATNLENRAAFRDQAVDAIALGASLYGLLRPAVAFETAMADVRKVVNFETPEQFGQMSKDVLELSTRIPMAAEGISAIVAAAGQAGIARHELLRFAEDAAKMGVAFDLTGQQAGAAMTGMRTIFGLTQDGVVELGNAINHLSNNMDAKASDMLNIANRAGSTARLFGLSGAQLNALGATFLALKTPAEVAGTSINALLMRLSTADRQSAAFQQGLQNIGLSAADMSQMIERDAQGALTTFLRQVQQAPDVMGTLSDLFGAEYADDIAKLVGSLGTYERAVGLVADQTAYAGSMQAEFEARSATTANNMQLLSSRVNRLAVTVGNVLLPAINTLVGVVAKPIEGLTALAERFPLVTQVIVGVVGAVIALQVATIALGFAWTFITGPVLAAQVAFQSARAHLALLQLQTTTASASSGLLAIVWQRLQASALGLLAPLKAAALSFWAMLPAIGATTAALLANPITWVVAGIGVAVAGLALVIRKYWNPLAAYIGGVFEGIRSGVQPAIDSLRTALEPLAPIGQALSSVLGFVSSGLAQAVGWVRQLLAPVTLTSDEFEHLSASGRSLGTVIGGVLGAAFTLLTLPIRMLGTLASWVLDGFRALAAFAPLSFISAAWQPVAGFFGGLWGGVVSGAQSAWQQLSAVLSSPNPLQALQTVLGSMLAALAGLPAQFAAMGGAMLLGLAQGVRNAAKQALAAVGEVAAGVRDRFKSMLGIRSPSRVFAALGGALSLGLAQGLAAAGPVAERAVGELAHTLQAVPLALSSPELAPPVAARAVGQLAQSMDATEPGQPGLRLPDVGRAALGLALAPVTTLAPMVQQFIQQPMAAMAPMMPAVQQMFTAPMAAAAALAPAASAGAQPLAAQPLAGARGGSSTNVSLTAPITVNAPPGMDAREIANLIEARLRDLVHTSTRSSPAAAMHD